ncbi:efflux RND transporter periplasmic adaptor subunit [Moraxella catarrhalis]|uniref:efflux RND transporter periplasmic adaptor subunit n=1 Tax=Moraxella catarrhalis TaxID=480 RepID=UPI000E4C2511|nr:biotin/lipoyl-binding protein [Moraxella catarrhalis]AXT98814.1 secretion protein HlyD [Moraxella catarrhalis]AZQ88703.1 hlyD secretion family protein [Moraxella catarrhalis]MCG6816461.1 biotin/lipoyl-binding protein [Moraxella catarrhalis]MPW72843.1 secretion protein HlyD [Moraxella catarrhalis]MPW94870.1 biotin/lipoyl-binding protein [Moraxella catarrhalis]
MGIIVGVLIGRFMLSPNQETPSKQAAQNQNAAVMAVEAVHPTSITIKNRLSANGIVAAVETAEVGSQISGVAIERVLVEVGEFVKAGQVLATLDTRTFEQQLSSAEAELATAVAAQEKAAADLARTEPLLAIDAVSRQEVDAYRTALRQALANVTAAQAHVESARTNQ